MISRFEEKQKHCVRYKGENRAKTCDLFSRSLVETVDNHTQEFTKYSIPQCEAKLDTTDSADDGRKMQKVKRQEPEVKRKPVDKNHHISNILATSRT